MSPDFPHVPGFPPEWNGASTYAQLKGKYYWGAQPVAYYIPGGAVQFEHQDWLGTERMRTTYNGGVQGSFTSLPFGDSQPPLSDTADANHYATLDHDTESDTEHAQFRHYSNIQGHWLTPDQYAGSYDFSNPQSFNRYAYVLNNPLAAIDPAGLDDCDADACVYGGDDDSGGLSPGYYHDQNGNNYYWDGQTLTAYDPQTAGVDGDPGACNMNNAACQMQYSELLQQQGSQAQLPLIPLVNGENYPSYKGLFCAGDALAANGVSLALDAAGFILPAKGVAGAVTQTVSGIASAFNSIHHEDGWGVGAGMAGEGLGLTYGGALAIGASWAGVIPGVSTALNVVTSVRDGIQTAKSYNDCMNGSKYD